MYKAIALLMATAWGWNPNTMIWRRAGKAGIERGTYAARQTTGLSNMIGEAYRDMPGARGRLFRRLLRNGRWKGMAGQYVVTWAVEKFISYLKNTVAPQEIKYLEKMGHDAVKLGTLTSADIPYRNRSKPGKRSHNWSLFDPNESKRIKKGGGIWKKIWNPKRDGWDFNAWKTNKNPWRGGMEYHYITKGPSNSHRPVSRLIYNELRGLTPKPNFRNYRKGKNQKSDYRRRYSR